ncbi:NADH-quinone oxidoreductase subunit NuoE [Tepidibacter formicigenes]|jgi:NADH-quinone oxidoreductase subunit E|uniref:NADH-quinone oxidoreductase subunit E n=1 Tax=Tepidibacter formicigenes DSM 15518 TaxID=1123349 RepID=A0A1M6S3F3_9FIRM|nr:NADH-quinone oxidoreductase subunit NuoE [Tepidibacter formicigenes]SHK39159.1 NADH-quinone oxidoreductase subunit E [Tepidibacter formicigenes DSM 15518]
MGREVFTEENYKKLDEVIQMYKGKPGALMPVLNEAQKIFGCVSLDIQKEISYGLNIPLAEIYGVATFYSQFSLQPKGEYVIGVCLGTACYVKGSQDIVNEISKKLNIEAGKTTEDGKFTLVATRCIGACGLAPVLTVNEEVYGKIKADDIDSLIGKYM